ncbi:hypothetical protein BV20DRAFT_943339 [Pilatotrama ljubarskyi]|nr:hypothetical protein BV20DRAFT_943339 [Pilatotrama ljubarskyi]
MQSERHPRSLSVRRPTSNNDTVTLTCSLTGILYYDYVLTLRDEVQRFWASRVSTVSVLFFFNRYLAVFAHIPVMVEFYGRQSETTTLTITLIALRCLRLQMYHQLLSGITQVIIGILQLARTYALYSQSRRVMYGLAGLCGTGCVIAAWALIKTWQGSRLRCLTDLAAVWACVLVFDAAVFVLTLVRVLYIGKTCRGSLFTVMLQDGECYTLSQRVASATLTVMPLSL